MAEKIRLVLELTPAEVDRLEVIQWYDDEGPRGEGWQSEAMQSLNAKIRAALEAAKAER